MRKLKLFNSFISTGSYSEFVKNIFELSEQKDCSVVALEEVPLKDTQKYAIRIN